MHKVLWPKPGHGQDIESQQGIPPRYATAKDWDNANGQVVEKKNGKFEYRNDMYQRHRRFYDLAVYLSPTRREPRHLVVQSTKKVLDEVHHDPNPNGDWLRSEISGSVPKVLKLSEWALKPMGVEGAGLWQAIHTGLRMLLVAVPLQLMLALSALPGVDLDDDSIADSYTDFCGYHWDWPKFAINDLDMQPPSAAEGKPPKEALPDSLDVRRRAIRPWKLIVDRGDGFELVPGHEVPTKRYVFISYNRWQFSQKFGDAWIDKIKQMAEYITREQGCQAYWFDELCMHAKKEGYEKDYDVYTMCDLVRGSAKVAVLLPENSMEQRVAWGRRLWCLPEGMLAPDDGVWCCYEDSQGKLSKEEVHKVEMVSTFWSSFDLGQPGGSAVRILAEHYSGLLTLSRLELLPTIINALRVTDWRNINANHSDMPYSVMGFLHYRVDKRLKDSGYTQFQSLARMCLGNDNDRIIERMISLLPKARHDDAGRGVDASIGRTAESRDRAVDNSDIWRILSERDEYGTLPHDITPLCDMVGIAHEDNTVIIGKQALSYFVPTFVTEDAVLMAKTR